MTSTRIAGFGEILLRLSAPGPEPILYSPRFDCHVGGAEANVCVGLAHLGYSARMISILPDGALGDGARSELRRHGVDTCGVASGEGRMGLYFHASGAGRRPGEILYDREASAFALGARALIDPGAALVDIDWLHVSGVTPAIGEQAAQAACLLAEAAAERGLRVSFDFNHRASLWARWGGDPTPYLKRIVGATTHLFANDHDLGRIIALPALNPSRQLLHTDHAFAAFPRLQWITSAFRTVSSVESHALSAEVVTRHERGQTPPTSIDHVVDRIGSGDAYAAGIIHACLLGASAQDAAEIGLAAAVLKHSLPGDFPRASAADLEAYRSDSGRDVRR